MDLRRSLSPQLHRPGRGREEIAGWEEAAIRGRPVLGDRPLGLGHIERPGTRQRAHSGLELVLPLGVPRRLKRSARLRPEVRVRIRAAEAERNQVVDLELWMRAEWHAVFMHDEVIASPVPMTQFSRAVRADIARVDGADCAWGQRWIRDDGRGGVRRPSQYQRPCDQSRYEAPGRPFRPRAATARAGEALNDPHSGAGVATDG